MTPTTDDELEAAFRAALDDGNADRIAALAAEIDAQDTRPTPVPLLAAALWYAEQGLHVFALQPHAAERLDKETGEIAPQGKAPHPGTHGFHDATTDPDTIRAWWDRWPDSNIGIATGHLVDVIDIDGPVGVKSYLEVLDELPTIHGKVSTPRPGGTHLYVTAISGRPNKTKLLPGIDYRGTGGYVVAPPSRISVGATPGDYTWRSPLDLAAVHNAARVTGGAA